MPITTNIADDENDDDDDDGGGGGGWDDDRSNISFMDRTWAVRLAATTSHYAKWQ